MSFNASTQKLKYKEKCSFCLHDSESKELVKELGILSSHIPKSKTISCSALADE
jgi:hypothetical protein